MSVREGREDSATTVDLHGNIGMSFEVVVVVDILHYILDLEAGHSCSVGFIGVSLCVEKDRAMTYG